MTEQDSNSKGIIARSRQARYDEILRAFGAGTRSGAECIQHLESLGFTRGQARNALYRFRQREADSGDRK